MLSAVITDPAALRAPNSETASASRMPKPFLPLDDSTTPINWSPTRLAMSVGITAVSDCMFLSTLAGEATKP